MEVHMQKKPSQNGVFRYIKFTNQLSFKIKFQNRGPTYRRQVVNLVHLCAFYITLDVNDTFHEDCDGHFKNMDKNEGYINFIIGTIPFKLEYPCVVTIVVAMKKSFVMDA